MEVLLDKKSATEASLSVKITSDDYRPNVDKTIKDYSKKVNLKGFRPGKVPPQVIQRMYGKDILIDEVNRLLSDTVSGYIRDNKLQVVGDPSINRQKADSIEWGSQTEFDFSYDLGLASDFEVDTAALPAVSAYTILAGEAELNETMENLSNQFGETIHAEVSEDGDMLFGELKQGEFSTKTAIPFREIKDDSKSKFVGIAKDSTITFDIRNTFASDRAVALLSGLKEEEAAAMIGDYEFVVEDITRKGPAQMNQEFFDKVLGVGKVDNEEDLKKEILSIVQDNYGREAAALLNRDIEEMLLKEINIELPDTFLKNWLFELNGDKYTMEQIEAEYDAFSKNLRLSLIRNKISDHAEIKVEGAEVIARAEAMVRSQFGLYGNDDQFQETINRIAMNHLKENNGEHYTKLFNDVHADKIMTHLRDTLTLDVKDIDVAQFKEIVKSINEAQQVM
jgi:trigger factor